MKIIFIEDSIEDMEHVKLIVSKFQEIVACYYTSASEFYEAKEESDAIILDIDIPDENGLCIAKGLRDHGYDQPIVFMSWHQDFEHESFEVQAFYFVRKEFMEIELERCLNKLIQDNYKRNGKFVYQDDEGELQISASSIVYIERDKNGICIYFTMGLCQRIRNMTIKKVLEQQINGWFQINKSTIVNFYHVKKYSKLDEIIMKGDIKLEVSRSKRKPLLNAYRTFIDRRS